MVTKEKVDTDLRGRIDRLELSDRLKAWKEAFLNASPKVPVERAELIIQSWQETEGEDIEIRWAKLLKKVLEGIPIAIYDFDLLVGRETQHLLGSNLHMELAGDYTAGLMREGVVTVGSPVARGVISQHDIEILRTCTRFWAGKTVSDRIKEVAQHAGTGTWWDDLIEARCTVPGMKGASYSFAPPSEKVLAKGLRGVIEEAELGIQRCREMPEVDIGKLNFYHAVIMVNKAVINFARRYAELARRMAEAEPDTTRRSELEEIAKVCEWVPEHPARTLHEAIQSMIFVRIACKLEMPGIGGQLGRADQYLWPYFEREVRDGDLTLERAVDLIGGFIAFHGSEAQTGEAQYQEFKQAMLRVGNLTLGGVNRDGEDATNELTYLFLHVAGLLKIPEPHVTLRWHPGTPRWLLLKAIETNVKAKGAIPQYMSDPHTIEKWTAVGVPLEEARDWYGTNCSDTRVGEPIQLRDGINYVSNLPLILDLALHNGVAPRTGKRIGMKTDGFKTFADLLEAFNKQHKFLLERTERIHEELEGVRARYVRQPFGSSQYAFCMENGMDYQCAGREVETTPDGLMIRMDRGVVDVADSLIAVKKLVFDEKKLTMPELIEALDSNFAGERGEEIRQMCLAAPKFGNDIDEVDEMVGKIGSLSDNVQRSVLKPGVRCVGIYRSGLAWHMVAGKGVGALPNGRKSGEPLDDGSISPMPGMDTHGPTATLRSVVKAGFKEAKMTVLNQKFPATLIQSPENREKFAALIDTFFRNGGQHIQFNIVDAQELREAKKHPELYRDLIVRVGGFSAYFVYLTPELQDDIIARTEQGL